MAKSQRAKSSISMDERYNTEEAENVTRWNGNGVIKSSMSDAQTKTTKMLHHCAVGKANAAEGRPSTSRDPIQKQPMVSPACCSPGNTHRRLKLSKLSHSSSYHTNSATKLASVRFCIGGMTNVACNDRIEHFLMDQRGVLRASSSLLSSRCDVDFDASIISPERLERLIQSLGFAPVLVPDDCIASVVLHMGCEQLDRARELLQGFTGVCAVKVIAQETKERTRSASQHQKAPSQLSTALLVQFDPETLGARTILRRLSAQLGVQLRATAPSPRESFDHQVEANRFRRLFAWSCACSLPEFAACLMAPVVFQSSPTNPFQSRIGDGVSVGDLVGFVCSTLILFGTAIPIHQRAISALQMGSGITTDALVSLSSGAAYGYSIVSLLSAAMSDHFRGDGAIPVSPIPISSTPTGLLASPMPTASHVVQHETLFEVTSFLLTLVLFSKWIESVVRARAVHCIDPLMDIQIRTAILLEKCGDESRESYIDVGLVERHDYLKILPGTRVPTDGIVVEGASSVDESMITGEPRQVSKEPGSIVLGGSINTQGVLVMRVTRIVSESMLARIIFLVDEAQTSKCNLQRMADKVSSILTTGTIALAWTMLVVWYVLASSDRINSNGWSPLAFALRFAITTLVISCPCAISFAVPTPVMVATTIGSQHGILIKGGHVVESLANVDVVMFDKSGTLTASSLAVVDLYRPGTGATRNSTDDESMDMKRFWQVVASVEQHSDHAIARALVTHALEHVKLSLLAKEIVNSFEENLSCGVRCQLEGVEIAIGSPHWIEHVVLNKSLPPEVRTRNTEFQSYGYTVVCVAINKTVDALIALNGRMRDEAAFVVEQLKQLEVDPWIVTGDQTKAALSLAQTLGVPEFHVVANASPTDKVQKIRLLQSMGKSVAFVGDGTSDAAAIATSDIGVAVGVGTEVALEAGDVVLVREDLCDLLNAVLLTKRANGIVRWNLGWAFFYNLTMIPLACGGLYAAVGLAIPPAFAGLSELLSSVPIMLLSLLINWWRPKFRACRDSVVIDVRAQEPTERTPLLRKIS